MRSSGTPTRSVGQYAQSWRASSPSSSARFLPLSKPSNDSVPPGPPATVASSALAASTISRDAVARSGSCAAADAAASHAEMAKTIVRARMRSPRCCVSSDHPAASEAGQACAARLEQAADQAIHGIQASEYDGKAGASRAHDAVEARQVSRLQRNRSALSAWSCVFAETLRLTADLIQQSRTLHVRFAFPEYPEY